MITEFGKRVVLQAAIIVATLIFAANAFAFEIEAPKRKDHITHLAVSTSMTYIIGEISQEPLAAFFTVNALGILKEIAYDKEPDWSDAHMNFIGSAIGATMSWTF